MINSDNNMIFYWTYFCVNLSKRDVSRKKCSIFLFHLTTLTTLAKVIFLTIKCKQISKKCKQIIKFFLLTRMNTKKFHDKCKQISKWFPGVQKFVKMQNKDYFLEFTKKNRRTSTTIENLFGRIQEQFPFEFFRNWS